MEERGSGRTKTFWAGNRGTGLKARRNAMVTGDPHPPPSTTGLKGRHNAMHWEGGLPRQG